MTSGPLDRRDGTASRRVTVRRGDRTTTGRWELELRTGDPREGCWLTTAVAEVEGTKGVAVRPAVDCLVYKALSVSGNASQRGICYSYGARRLTHTAGNVGLRTDDDRTVRSPSLFRVRSGEQPVRSGE